MAKQPTVSDFYAKLIIILVLDLTSFLSAIISQIAFILSDDVSLRITVLLLMLFLFSAFYFFIFFLFYFLLHFRDCAL